MRGINEEGREEHGQKDDAVFHVTSFQGRSGTGGLCAVTKGREQPVGPRASRHNWDGFGKNRKTRSYVS